MTLLPLFGICAFIIGMTLAAGAIASPSPYAVLERAETVYQQVLGNALVASGLWYVRWRIRSYINSQLGNVSSYLKPIAGGLDPIFIALASMFTAMAFIPFYPPLITAMVVFKTAVGGALWATIHWFSRNREYINALLGKIA